MHIQKNSWIPTHFFHIPGIYLHKMSPSFVGDSQVSFAYMILYSQVPSARSFSCAEIVKPVHII